MRTAQKLINKDQIKIIYTLGKELGLVDRMVAKDILHSMVESITGKEHISELTTQEAAKVIDRLKGGMKGTNRINANPYSPTKTKRDGRASDGQLKKIWALIYELRKYDSPENSPPLQQRLRGFIKKYAGIDDIKFLTDDKANSVIEGLKGLVATEERKFRRSL